MADFFAIITIAVVLIAFRLTFQVRTMLRNWTVSHAWTWMAVALLVVMIDSMLSMPFLRANETVRSGMAYFSATMLLAPLVTVLGARRPGIFAWHWFVVLPMIVILLWPAVSQLHGNNWRTPIELSAPLVMGVVVVLAMSAGTFLGTHSSVFVIFYAASILAFLESNSLILKGGWTFIRIGPFLILTAIGIFRGILLKHTADLQAASTASRRSAALIDLFGSLYGFAWSRRVLDRTNQFAVREQWTVRLTSSGFVRPDGVMPGREELRKPLEALIWVLSRFGDEPWLRSALRIEPE